MTRRESLPYLFLPFAAFIAVMPLIVHGPSCGHDFTFHIVSWLEAAAQFRHGNLHPRWAFSPAWNAGEPRFVFYPPISWTLGGILGLIMPWTWTPIVYTWLALSASGLAMYRLTRGYAAPAAALLASTLYLVNPYMLFTAYERTAYAELLAAAFLPLLLRGILKPRPTVTGIAFPLALLWLTNAPAGVMGTYTLAVLATVRLIQTYLTPSLTPSGPTPSGPTPSVLHSPTTRLALTTVAGTLLGISLAAFYLLPAAIERAWVQISMVVVPGMRIEDNTLFHRTGLSGDALAHDAVLHTASLIALILILASLLTLIPFYKHARVALHLSGEMESAIAYFDWRLVRDEHRCGVQRKNLQAAGPEVLAKQISPRRSIRAGRFLQASLLPIPPLAILTAIITFLLTSLSLPVWNHAPELTFLQFPWRLLAVQAAALTLIVSLALQPLGLRASFSVPVAVLSAVALVVLADRTFHQYCGPDDCVQTTVTSFQERRGIEPTDEYTPNSADNDSLGHHNPPFWLSADSLAPPPFTGSVGPTPTDIKVHTLVPQYLILNLRRFPTWHAMINGEEVKASAFDQTPRADGLLTLPVSPGSNHVVLSERSNSLDFAADALSTASFLAALVFVKIRK